MGAFLSKKLTHNMGPFVRKFPCITYNGAFCSLKFCLYIFFFQTFFNFSSSFFFFFFLLFFLFFSFFSPFFLFLFFNFPGGGRRPTLAPPLRVAHEHSVILMIRNACSINFSNALVLFY